MGSKYSGNQNPFPQNNLSATVSIQGKSLAQIDAPYFRVVTQLARRAGTKDFSLRNNVRPISDRKRLAHIVISDQDADAAGLEIEDDLLQVEHRDRIDATEG